MWILFKKKKNFQSTNEETDLFQMQIFDQWQTSTTHSFLQKSKNLNSTLAYHYFVRSKPIEYSLDIGFCLEKQTK